MYVLRSQNKLPLNIQMLFVSHVSTTTHGQKLWICCM